MSEYIYGRNPVIEGIKAGRVKKLYIQGGLEGSAKKIFAMAREEKILITEVSKRKLDELAEGGNHQGVVALANKFKYSSLEEIISLGIEKILILDKIEDPHNFGAIARSAEAFGFKGIIIPKRNSVYVTDTVVKVSAGAVENLKIAIEINLSNAIEKLKDSGYWVYATKMDGENLYDTDLSGKVVLIIGNEGKGVSQNLLKHSDKVIKIPMQGDINSLNASCAASVIMAEVSSRKYR